MSSGSGDRFEVSFLFDSVHEYQDVSDRLLHPDELGALCTGRAGAIVETITELHDADPTLSVTHKYPMELGGNDPTRPAGSQPAYTPELAVSTRLPKEDVMSTYAEITERMSR